MPGYAVAIVLFAALLHALWNAPAEEQRRQAAHHRDAHRGGGLMAAVVLPFAAGTVARQLAVRGAGSSCAEVVYFVLLAAAYRSGDMSHAYPIMRGTAPLIVAGASASLIGERAVGGRMARRGADLLRGAGLALHGGVRGAAPHVDRRWRWPTRCTIATYTLIDGLGVRRSHAPAAYTLWMYVLTGGVTVAWALLRQPAANSATIFAAGHARGRGGGAGMISSYGLALWAMTVAPVALVAALRETCDRVRGHPLGRGAQGAHHAAAAGRDRADRGRRGGDAAHLIGCSPERQVVIQQQRQEQPHQVD